MNTKELYKFLGEDDVVIKIALLAGFIQILRCTNFLEAPLTALCVAICSALIYAVLAKVVTSFSPEILKPLISIVFIISIIYYVFFKKKCLTLNDIMKKNKMLNDEEQTIIINRPQNNF